jgi:heparosan-N-sulfate-glucuronate 5-epimerase
MRATRRGRHIDTTSPRGYYFDYSPCADPRGPVGEDGLPLSRGGGRTCNPAEVARYALGNLEVYLGGGSEARRDRFERAAAWLADHMEFVPGNFGGWAMPDPPAAFRGRLSPGWFSGATQAECVSTLVRASLLLGLRGAIEAAREAFPAFRTPVEEGGLLREVGERGHEGAVESLAVIEEYPMPGRPSMALSGHARAVWSIFDYWRATGDGEAERLFERCVRGTEFVLDRYEVGRWARADLDSGWRGRRPASSAGMAEQALALRVLADLTGRSAFEQAADRWRGYAASPWLRLRATIAATVFALANPGAPWL